MLIVINYYYDHTNTNIITNNSIAKPMCARCVGAGPNRSIMMTIVVVKFLLLTSPAIYSNNQNDSS